MLTREDLDRAELKLRREAVLADLVTRPGLALAPLPGEPFWAYAVAYNGQLLGEVRTASAGPLHDWSAYPAPGPATGPYLTARIAAKALVTGASQAASMKGRVS